MLLDILDPKMDAEKSTIQVREAEGHKTAEPLRKQKKTKKPMSLGQKPSKTIEKTNKKSKTT